MIAGIVVAVLGAIAAGVGFAFTGIPKLVLIIIGVVMLLGGILLAWLSYQKESASSKVDLTKASTEQIRAKADSDPALLEARTKAFTKCQNDCLKNQGLFKDPKACESSCNRAIGR